MELSVGGHVHDLKRCRLNTGFFILWGKFEYVD